MNATHALGQFPRTLPHSAAATFLALFPIVDPFGGIPIFFTMTSAWTAQDRRRTAVKPESGCSSSSGLFCSLADSCCIFSASRCRAEDCRRPYRCQYCMGYGHVPLPHHARESHETQGKEDISLTPLAMPLLSAPGAIGVVMALAAHVDSAASYFGMVIGIAGIALSVLLSF
jgi:multiple antibiotic resistance protein